jgi:hypothetical protein
MFKSSFPPSGKSPAAVVLHFYPDIAFLRGENRHRQKLETAGERVKGA